jgi:multiple sugar transport system substrate-binding protein
LEFAFVAKANFGCGIIFLMPQLKFTQQQIMIIAIVAVVIIGGGALLFLNGQKKSTTAAQAVSFSVWGTDDAKVFDNLIAYYGQYNSSAKVTYTQIDPADYENTLLRAFAEGNGPDVFEIGNRALPKWQSVLAPLPAAYYTQFGPLQLTSDFPAVVQSDFTASSTPTSTSAGIYALPLSIDTLAMFYNKDLFDSAGIATPPATWDDFENDIQKLRTFDAGGQIVQAAAAIGGSEASVSEAPDILSLLMLQNGTQMVSSDLTAAKFAGDATSPGLSAFNFYLQFANAASPYYTWNDSMGNDVQNFINGKTAIIFGYHDTLADIQAKAPFMNVGIAPVPQPAGANISISYPKYNGLAVYKKSAAIISAWQFVLSLTTYANGEKIYTDGTGNPPALRTAITAAENDPNLSVFAKQALTARSWYEVDDEQVNSILNAAIENTLSGSATAAQSLGQAQSSISSLMFQYQRP